MCYTSELHLTTVFKGATHLKTRTSWPWFGSIVSTLFPFFVLSTPISAATIFSDLPAEPLIVKVDSDFMKQAVLNIVLNGVQAMPQGGQLDIVARREDHVVVTEISDQGDGIPAEVQEKIFELYFTTKKGGSGIGLAQTYQILQWHYGSVEFDTAPGKGTTFRLRIPLAETSLDDLKEMTAKS